MLHFTKYPLPVLILLSCFAWMNWFAKAVLVCFNLCLSLGNAIRNWDAVCKQEHVMFKHVFMLSDYLLFFTFPVVLIHINQTVGCIIGLVQDFAAFHLSRESSGTHHCFSSWWKEGTPKKRTVQPDVHWVWDASEWCLSKYRPQSCSRFG